jgi:perosamine synthetase
MKNNEYIPVNEPLLTGNEKKYVTDCIETGWISSEGAYVSRFENRFATFVHRDFGIAVSSGSVALDTAITALGLGPHDEVIMPTFTIISCAAAIIRSGAIPVLVDCDEKTWNMNVHEIKSRITPRTKAIMVVHIYGLPVDMDPIITIAEENNLLIIEDAAEAHGQMYNGLPCGSFGDISIFSFYPNKLVTTGEGGMIVTNSEEIAQKCRLYRNLYFQPGRRFVHTELGWNFRLTNIQAALGLAQLEQINRFIKIKQHLGSTYTNLLRNITKIQLPIEGTKYADNLYWVYGIVIHDDIDLDAEAAMSKLKTFNIGTRPFFWPMHEQPIFQKMGLFKGESYPVAERIARNGFYLPSGLTLTDDQIDRVSQAMRSIFK